MTKIEYQFEMQSDWSVSTGSVRQGALDSVVYRDADGLPALPFSTIRGIWRDSAELLAGALEADCGSGWKDAVGLLFGDEPGLKGPVFSKAPRRSRLQASDACLPKSLRDELIKRPALKSSLTFAKPGVAIDDNSGMARDDALRFDEVANAGLMLSGTAEMDVDGLENVESANAFLTAALLLVTHVGGNRRRGAGRCTVEVNHLLDVAAAVKNLKDKNAPFAKPRAASARPAINTTLSTDEWQVLDLTIEIKSPVVIPKQVTGNTTTCEDSIPGTVLVGPVLKLLASARQDADALFSQLAAGNVIVEPAYPMLNGKRTLPAPAFWHQHKDDKGGPDDKGKIIAAFPAVEPGEFLKDSVPKSQAGRFFATGKNAVGTAVIGFVKAQKAIWTRNIVDDKTQKPNSDTGGVFSYEHLMAAQKFAARVRVRKGVCDIASAIHKDSDAYIGTAKATGFGKVNLKLTLSSAGAAKQVDQAATVQVWLQSPALIDADAASADLKDAFKSLLGLKDSKVVALMGKPERIDGWISSWALPRGTLFAFTAGTIVRLNLDESEIDTLNQKLRDGIGARRGEGFGVIALADETIAAPPQAAWPPEGDKPEDSTKTPAALPLLPRSGPLFKLAQHIEKIAVHDAIRLATEALGSDKQAVTEALGFGNDDKMSQVGNLRSVMGAFHNETRVEATKQFLTSTLAKHQDKKKTASWAEKAKPFFDDRQKLWQKLETKMIDAQLEERLITMSLHDAKRNAEFWRYAMRSFVHAAMKHSLKT